MEIPVVFVAAPIALANTLDVHARQAYRVYVRVSIIF